MIRKITSIIIAIFIFALILYLMSLTTPSSIITFGEILYYTIWFVGSLIVLLTLVMGTIYLGFEYKK